jgi:hypothetical protein
MHAPPVDPRLREAQTKVEEALGVFSDLWRDDYASHTSRLAGAVKLLEHARLELIKEIHLPPEE